MPSIVGTLVVSVPTSASPGAVALGADVPAGANLCLAFLSGSNDAGVTLTSLASNFTSAFTVTNHPGFTGLGVQFAVAAITSTGAGKTVTPVWSTGVSYGPTCTLVFMSVTDPATAIRDLDLNNSDGGTAVTLTVDSSTSDIVLAYDSRYNTNPTLPGTNAGYTSVVTQADYGGAATRLSQANAPGASTTSGSTNDTQYSGLVLVSVRDSGGGDTTAPTLSGASGAPTSTSAATLQVTTDEANGTLYAAVVLTSEPSPSAAQVILGQDSHNSPAPAAASGAVDATGVRTLNVTGLTPGETYTAYFVHRDAATNTSTVAPSGSWTQPSPDSTLPTMNGAITVGAKTSSTITISWPAASDNIGVTGYEVSSNGGGSWADVGSVLTIQFTGLAALTAYDLRVRAYDAAGNRAATPLATTTSTYRAGASAGSIRTATGPQDGNPAGLLYAFCELLPVSDWVSYTIVSGPTPAGGTLDAQANGAFSYVGPEPATLTIQPEVNGAASGDPIVVTLYDGSAPTGAGSDTAAAASTQTAGAALGGVDTDTAAATHSQAAVATAGGGGSETATAADTPAATVTGGRSAVDTAAASAVAEAALVAANYGVTWDTGITWDTGVLWDSAAPGVSVGVMGSDVVTATVATTYAVSVVETARPADVQSGNSFTPPAYTGGAPARIALRIGLGL